MGFCHGQRLDHPLEKINRIGSEGSVEADDKKEEGGRLTAEDREIRVDGSGE